MKLFSIITAVGLVASLSPSHAQAEDASSKVETCSRNFGTIAVIEPHEGWSYLGHYGLGSPDQLLRMMIEKSGCFDVVERGRAMDNMHQERSLSQSGDLADNASMGKGMMQAADFVMTPAIQVSSNDTGGIAAQLSGWLPSSLGTWAGLAGGLKFKEAATSLLIADTRSSLQVASAEGQAKKTDFSVEGWGYANLFGSAGGYTNTPEGKVISASLLDNYNKIVQTIRDKSSLVKVRSASSGANAAVYANRGNPPAAPAATAPITTAMRAATPQEAGQILQAKIANVKVYATASKDGKVVGTAQRSDEMVASGDVSNEFIKVDAANFSGWILRTLVAPK